ncbi:hypothetical protein C1645_875900 [Glomus cerebriforme]|uniref:Concanavalin A-like lectin/glucanase domain-containing protein n=1 Tax=Glomus cerebriforme TaxID=658196 RepID=A0A397SYM1_9GLOM|nr:hypothetical protein C1645_875900 [Glomus cerebriforme]
MSEMMRGYSLEQDLRLLINNPKYSDIEILCGDEKKLYCSRAILAARSEVFDGLLYNGMKESYENQVSFPTINSSTMEIILEYTYTGSVKEESLTMDNIVEIFSAADYLQLLNLQNFIMKTVKNALKKNDMENYSPELLSKAIDTLVVSEDNIFLNLLVETIATIPLNTIEFGRLSTAAFQYLLSYTYKKKMYFATPEYEVFRYSAILVAKQVSNDSYKTLMKLLPTLEQLENSIKVKNEDITNRQKIIDELKPLVKFIDFRRIKEEIITDIIEPLEITPTVKVYRHQLRSPNTNCFRGTPYNFGYIWDESARGSKLIIEDNGKVVCAAQSDHYILQSVRAKIVLGYKGIFEWDVIIEKICDNTWIGVCASENFNYETWKEENHSNGWVLGSNGQCWNSRTRLKYCPSFDKDCAKITVHLDMNKKTCAFTVNGIKYPEVSGWNNFPSKLYPVVSLYRPGRVRIQPHQKS